MTSPELQLGHLLLKDALRDIRRAKECFKDPGPRGRSAEDLREGEVHLANATDSLDRFEQFSAGASTVKFDTTNKGAPDLRTFKTHEQPTSAAVVEDAKGTSYPVTTDSVRSLVAARDSLAVEVTRVRAALNEAGATAFDDSVGFINKLAAQAKASSAGTAEPTKLERLWNDYEKATERLPGQHNAHDLLYAGLAIARFEREERESSRS